MYLLNYCHRPPAHNQLKKIAETNGDNGVNMSSKSGGSAVKPGQGRSVFPSMGTGKRKGSRTQVVVLFHIRTYFWVGGHAYISGRWGGGGGGMRPPT